MISSLLWSRDVNHKDTGPNGTRATKIPGIPGIPSPNPSWSEDGRDVGGLVRGRDSGGAGFAFGKAQGPCWRSTMNHAWCVCVGTGMNLNVTCFPMSVYVYIYAYDDRYKCCSSYKCSFQLAIATQSSRCRSHPILTGNPLWMPSSSYTANLHELWHPRIHWFQYCGTSIVLRIS